MMRLASVGLWLGLSAVSCTGKPMPPEPTDVTPPSDPYVLVLGTAQDGGFPQIASRHRRAQAARANPQRRRLVASLLLVDPRSSQRWLIDASPDIAEQVERAEGHPPGRTPGRGRPPLFEGIFLTHAHMGHYTGLLQLGREAYAAAGQPVLCSQSMADYLSSNGPWDLLVREHHIALQVLEPDVPVELGDGLSVTPFEVPHRGEYTDTFGFEIRGPQRAVAYIPDIDKWERWERPIEELLAAVDVALVDGTFFENGEIPGRDMAEIPHPFIEESIQRLGRLDAGLRGKVVFTHLNHSNPATEIGGAAQRRIHEAGMRVANEGEILPLGDP